MAGRNSGSGLVKGFILLCIGCVLVAIGLSFGGQINNNKWWSWNSDGPDFTWNDFDDENTIRDVEVLEETFSSKILKLDINLKAARLVIKTGEVAGYSATDFQKGGIRISIDGAKLSVDERDWEHGFSFGNNGLKPLLEITFPEGTNLEECKISMGAGSVDIEGISGNRVEIGSGAGSIKGSGITAQKAVLKTGAGSLDFTSCSFQDTDVETGAGRIAFEGDLTGNTDISTGAGSVELSLVGAEDDYRIDFSRGIGSVRIGADSYNGVGNGSAGNKSADRRIKLSTGVGSVRISFEE